MSQDDAPNLREVDPNKSCQTCDMVMALLEYGLRYKGHCRKHDFVIINSCKLVCDDWKENK